MYTSGLQRIAHHMLIDGKRIFAMIKYANNTVSHEIAFIDKAVE